MLSEDVRYSYSMHISFYIPATDPLFESTSLGDISYISVKIHKISLLVLTASLGVKNYSVKQTKAKQKWKIISLGNPLSKSENVLLLLSGIYFMMTSVWRPGQNILDHSHSTIQARKMERRSTKIKPVL